MRKILLPQGGIRTTGSDCHPEPVLWAKGLCSSVAKCGDSSLAALAQNDRLGGFFNKLAGKTPRPQRVVMESWWGMAQSRPLP
jgi:hypothetical protein